MRYILTLEFAGFIFLIQSTLKKYKLGKRSLLSLGPRSTYNQSNRTPSAFRFRHTVNKSSAVFVITFLIVFEGFHLTFHIEFTFYMKVLEHSATGSATPKE